jgi:uncharacterized iron-regulated membrane protein
MIQYLFTVFAAVVGAWAFLVLVVGRVLVRPRRPHTTAAVPPTRPEPKRREDFTLVA